MFVSIPQFFNVCGIIVIKRIKNVSHFIKKIIFALKNLKIMLPKVISGLGVSIVLILVEYGSGS